MKIFNESVAKALLKEIKKFIDNTPVIKLPNKGEKRTELVYSINNIRNEFTINVFRSNKDQKKFNFVLIYNVNKQPLLRLDTGDVIHTNPDGEKIVGSHIHFYKDGHATNYAYEFIVEDYSSIELYEYFLELVNVIEYNSIEEIIALWIWRR